MPRQILAYIVDKRDSDAIGEWFTTKQELEEFLSAMERVRVANTASPEKARQFLKKEGYLTENGDVAEPYASVNQITKS